jgi:hypothetical protein
MKIIITLNRYFTYSEYQCGHNGRYITALVNLIIISLQLYFYEDLFMESINYNNQVRSNFQFYK